jgi:beta-glucosidase
VSAVLETWYPGQEGGTALAEILFGTRSPEGKLPATFDRSWEENPAHNCYVPIKDPATGVPHIAYAEGLFMGYRYYASRNLEPLFPFGFGLSYTTFSFSHLVVPESASATAGFTVSFDVTNTGQRTGAEVAQLYVRDPGAISDQRPLVELKAFQKVRLAPGETRRVTLELNRRSFAHWDVVANDWRVQPGEFTLLLGDSSAHPILSGRVAIGP